MILFLRNAFVFTILLLSTFATKADALEMVSYTKERLKNRQEAGSKTVVFFYAGWCPVCSKQEEAIKKINSPKELLQVKILRADFDTEIELKHSLNVSSQSTLVLLSKGQEMARSSMVTDSGELKSFLLKALP